MSAAAISTWVTALRARLRDESGVAMIVAMSTLLITSLLTAAAATLALDTNQVTRTTSAQKQALEAAEAGLQVALYRYNMLQPAAANCVGDAVGAPAADGACESSLVTLGNGATYRYYTTPQLSGSGTCVGGVVSSSEAVNNICVTAVGASGGAVARTELRAASFAGTPLFPYHGLIGLQSIADSGNLAINAAVASNGPISDSGNLTVGSGYQIVLGPTASYTRNGSLSGVEPAPTRLSSPIVLSPIAPGNSSTTNNNTAYTVTSGSANYDPTTRAFSTTGATAITLNGGIYNFCSFESHGNLTVNIATGAKVSIYIDSPSDPGSGCPAGSGDMNLSGASFWSNPSGDPTALQLYVLGQNNLNISGNYTFNGTIYAPSSSVDLSGSVTFDGAIAADNINISGGAAFNWENQVSSLQATLQGVYYRTAWGRCTTAVSTSAPMTGCS